MSKKEDAQKMPKAMYSGKLPIGDIELDCAVLDDDTRILSATSVFKSFERPQRGLRANEKSDGVGLPAFLIANNLRPYINQNVIEWIQPVEYIDGKSVKKGYRAGVLPKVCDVYLAARRDDALQSSQQAIAVRAEILLAALAHVGIDALVDEATGFQRDRKHDALRLLLARYIDEGLRAWLKTFPDSFFLELDRLYGNAPTASNKRPFYYGRFINSYIYKPMENGYVKAKLDELNIDDAGRRKARFHQWLTDHGRSMLLMQIGRVQLMMEMCDNMDEFKKKSNKIKTLTIAPNIYGQNGKLLDCEADNCQRDS